MSELKTIVVPTDFSDTSRAALSWARRMAEQLDAELHCVTVVQQPIVYGAVTNAALLAKPSIEKLTSEARNQLNTYIEKHLQGLARPAVAETLVGRPADEITRYASQLDATMIVMATRGRSGVAHLLIGSTAESVIRQAQCPVLSIRKSDS